MSTEEVEKLQFLSKSIVDRYLQARHVSATLDFTLANDDFNASINNSYEAHTANLLQHRLYADLIRDISALFTDQDGRVGNVKRLLQSLENEQMRNELKQCLVASIRDPHLTGSFYEEMTEQERESELEKIRDRKRIEKAQSFDTRYEEVVRLGDLLNSEPLKNIRQARHQIYAHFQLANNQPATQYVSPKEFGLTWGMPINILAELQPLVLGLDLLCNDSYWAEEDFMNMFQKYAACFWRRFMSGTPQEINDI